MNIEPIVDHLVANGIGRKGVDIFGHSFPATVVNGVLVVSNSPIKRHAYQKGRRDGSIQILVRGVNYNDIQVKAESIANLLDAEGLVLGGIKFLNINPTDDPLVYPRSEGSQLEASVNFNFTSIV